MDIFDWAAEFVQAGFDVMFFAELHPVAAILRTISAVLIVGSLFAFGLDISGGYPVIPRYWSVGLLQVGLIFFLLALIVTIVTRES